MNNLKFEHYKKFKPFDEIKFPDLLKLVNKSKDVLLEDGWLPSGKDSILDVIDVGDEKYRFTKLGLYYPKSRNPEEVLNITLDIQNKTILKDKYHNGTYAFIELPSHFLKKYLNQFNHNSDTTILDNFLNEVDWEGDWKSLRDEYDKKYPEKLYTSNKKEGEFVWRANFSIEWFLSIKYDGLITPLFKLQEDTRIFNRGSHRAFMLSRLGYGIPMFIPKFRDKVIFKTLRYFEGMELDLEVDYINRELNFYNGKDLLEKYKYD